MKFKVCRDTCWPFYAQVFDETGKRVCAISPHAYSTSDKSQAAVDARPENAPWLEMLNRIGGGEREIFYRPSPITRGPSPRWSLGYG